MPKSYHLPIPILKFYWLFFKQIIIMTYINISLSYYTSTIFHGFGREVVEVGARLRLGLLALIDLSASITESRANFDLNRVVVTEKKKKKFRSHELSTTMASIFCQRRRRQRRRQQRWQSTEKRGPDFTWKTLNQKMLQWIRFYCDKNNELEIKSLNPAHRKIRLKRF